MTNINTIVIATVKTWNIRNVSLLKEVLGNKYRVFLLTEKEQLTFASMKEVRPLYIFFPHWSWLIPEEIYNNFNCVVFHMTDLPFGRGGSPLQNLLVRGFAKTKISALKVEKDLDAGPIYFKKNLSLQGRAEEIYERASKIVFREMIPVILLKNLKPKAQKGKVIVFQRRKPEESKIPEDISFNRIYDFVRMLDAEGYPPAFMETGKLRLEFKKAVQRGQTVTAGVVIKKKEDGHEK